VSLTELGALAAGAKMPSIFLRSFFGFSPEEDGYIGWTQEKHRTHIMKKAVDGDLFLIYGAGVAATPRAQRRQVLGVLQIDIMPIRDSDKASAAGMKRKADNKWLGQWSLALPVRRAWRGTKPYLVDYVATDTYRSDAGQAIATWSPRLSSADVARVMKLPLVEVPVFGEAPLLPPAPAIAPLIESFRPSNGLVPAFGTTSVTKADGEHRLYIMRMEGDVAALLGRPSPSLYRKALVKVGFSNDMERRRRELNAGLPPAGKVEWKLHLSHGLSSGADAKALEDRLKDLLAKHAESLGGEFFLVAEAEIMPRFASVLPARS
jgi:hypothetical protein